MKGAAKRNVIIVKDIILMQFRIKGAVFVSDEVTDSHNDYPFPDDLLFDLKNEFEEKLAYSELELDLVPMESCATSNDALKREETETDKDKYKAKKAPTLSKEEKEEIRKKKVQRFRERRKKRKWTHIVRYKKRCHLASKRLRIGGKFVKEECEDWSTKNEV